MLEKRQDLNSDSSFEKKHEQVLNLTKDPFEQIEMFENEAPKDRLLQLAAVAQETFLYTRDKLEVHSSDLNLLYRAIFRLTRLAKEDLSDFEYCYVLSNLDHVTNKLLKSCEEVKTFSDSPMVGKKHKTRR